VGEGALAVAVPQGSDVSCGGLEFIAPLDIAPLFRLDLGLIESEVIRSAPGPLRRAGGSPPLPGERPCSPN